MVVNSKDAFDKLWYRRFHRLTALVLCISIIVLMYQMLCEKSRNQENTDDRFNERNLKDIRPDGKIIRCNLDDVSL